MFLKILGLGAAVLSAFSLANRYTGSKAGAVTSHYAMARLLCIVQRSIVAIAIIIERTEFGYGLLYPMRISVFDQNILQIIIESKFFYLFEEFMQ